jgi:hypothetical protein
MCRFPLSASQPQYWFLTAETELAPLAQSVERIHGKENSGLFSSSGDQQEQPFVQANADRSIWIKWQRVAGTGTGWRKMLMSFLARSRQINRLVFG